MIIQYFLGDDGASLTDSINKWIIQQGNKISVLDIKYVLRENDRIAAFLHYEEIGITI